MQRDLNRRLVWLVLFVLIVIGSGLIFVIYGAPASLLGLACLVVGGGFLGLLWLIFTVIEKWAQ